MLVVENLVHRYAAAPVLQIANLRMNRNERWLVAGASGSGKTTLLAVFAGLLAVTGFFQPEELRRLRAIRRGSARGCRPGWPRC